MRLPLSAAPATTIERFLTRPANIAHRGASEVAPENTLAAVRSAARLGADLVEVDVQRTRDGALVLMHDVTLRRTTNVEEVFPRRTPWRVADFTHDELLRLDAGSWKGARFTGERVPLLSDVVHLLRGSGTGLLVELKEPGLYSGVVRDLAAVLDEPSTRTATEPLVVESFDFAAMKELKTLEPSLRVGLLGTPARANLAALGSWADQVNPPHRSVDAAYVDAVHRAGMECHVWTVNRRGAMQRAVGLGVDGVITNRPALLGRLLDAGGAFPRSPGKAAPTTRNSSR